MSTDIFIHMHVARVPVSVHILHSPTQGLSLRCTNVDVLQGTG